MFSAFVIKDREQFKFDWFVVFDFFLSIYYYMVCVCLQQFKCKEKFDDEEKVEIVLTHCVNRPSIPKCLLLLLFLGANNAYKAPYLQMLFLWRFKSNRSSRYLCHCHDVPKLKASINRRCFWLKIPFVFA